MIRTAAFLTLAEMDQVHELAPRWGEVREHVQRVAVEKGLWLFYVGPFDLTRKGEFLAQARREGA